MIRVKRSRVLTPAALNGPNSKGAREREKAVAFYTDPDQFLDDEDKVQSFDFKVYKDDTIKSALNELFHGKCAYCESIYEATQPMDVEHYRPKGGVVVDGKLQKPGYYWLAATWDNLLPSCIDCNRSRTQEFPDEDPRPSGKENLFPIQNKDSRATAPGEESGERRLLLDPCRDRPEVHLEFLDEGLVRPVLKSGNRPSPKGRASIEVYGLQRRPLVEARRDRLLILRAHLSVLAKLTLLMEQDPDNPTLENVVEETQAELRRLQADDQPYAAMARQFVKNIAASRT